MRFRSKKTAHNYIERRKLVAERMEETPWCEVPWCGTTENLSPHEPLTRARGGSILDKSNIRIVCWDHNQELTLEPPWGYELGFLRHSWDEAAS